MVGRRSGRWSRWRTVLLVGLLLLPGTPEVLSRLSAEQAQRERALALLAPGRNVLPVVEERHQQAPPDPSGAFPPYPLNHTFDADVITLAGSPTNHDFETAAAALGTPPSNHDFASSPTDAGTPPNNYDFASGDFTGWTTAGSPTIQSDTPHGNYAQLAGANAAVTTDPYTVDTSAQVVVAEAGFLGTGTNILYVYVLSGSGYGTSTLVWLHSCSSCQYWEELTFDAAPWRGQSIKLKFARFGGTVAVDAVRPRVLFPDYAASGALNRLFDGSDPYAWLGVNGTVTSAAFTVEATAQFATLAARAVQ